MKKTISIFLVFTLVLACMPWNLPSYSAPQPGGSYAIYQKAEIAETKRKITAGDAKTVTAFDQFMARVDDWCMLQTCKAIADFRVPGYYEEPIEHIANSKSITYDAYTAYAVGLAWQLTGETQYAEKARAMLNGWATTNIKFTISGNYGDTPLVAAYSGVGLIYGAELITEYDGWTQNEQDKFKQWVTKVYQPAILSIVSRESGTNWASWGTMASMATYHYLGDVHGVNSMVSLIPELIRHQISTNGEILPEAIRGVNGMWYSYFCLAPLMQAAQMAYNLTGRNYFAYETNEGASFKKALDYLLPYVKEPSLWDAKYKQKYYPGQTLNTPKIHDGTQLKPDGITVQPNWPSNLYAAMGNIYSMQGEEYGELISGVAPVMGGWTEREAHHMAWCFPSLMEPANMENIPLYPDLPSPESLPESISDDFQSDVIDSDIWHIERYPIKNQMSGVSAGSRVADGDPAANLSLKLFDNMAGAFDAAKSIKTGCVEVETMVRPGDGLAEVEFDIMFTATLSGSSGSGVHIEDAYNTDASLGSGAPLVSLMINNSGDLFIRRPSTPGGPVSDFTLTSVDFGKWIKVRIFINTAAKTYDVYIDNVLKASDQNYRSASAVSMSRVKFATDAAASNTINFMDNVYAGPLREEGWTPAPPPPTVVPPTSTPTPPTQTAVPPAGITLPPITPGTRIVWWEDFEDANKYPTTKTDYNVKGVSSDFERAGWEISRNSNNNTDMYIRQSNPSAQRYLRFSSSSNQASPNNNNTASFQFPKTFKVSSANSLEQDAGDPDFVGKNATLTLQFSGLFAHRNETSPNKTSAIALRAGGTNVVGMQTGKHSSSGTSIIQTYIPAFGNAYIKHQAGNANNTAMGNYPTGGDGATYKHEIIISNDTDYLRAVNFYVNQNNSAGGLALLNTDAPVPLTAAAPLVVDRFSISCQNLGDIQGWAIDNILVTFSGDIVNTDADAQALSLYKKIKEAEGVYLALARGEATGTAQALKTAIDTAQAAYNNYEADAATLEAAALALQTAMDNSVPGTSSGDVTVTLTYEEDKGMVINTATGLAVKNGGTVTVASGTLLQFRVISFSGYKIDGVVYNEGAPAGGGLFKHTVTTGAITSDGTLAVTFAGFVPATPEIDSYDDVFLSTEEGEAIAVSYGTVHGDRTGASAGIILWRTGATDVSLEEALADPDGGIHVFSATTGAAAQGINSLGQFGVKVKAITGGSYQMKTYVVKDGNVSYGDIVTFTVAQRED